MKGLRGERLGSQFREEISAVISTKLRNKYPQLSAIISITHADVAPDLKSAKVFVSIYDTDEKRKQESMQILLQNASFIRHELAAVLHIRTVPEIRFVTDGSFEYGSRIDRLLEEISLPPEDEQGGEDKGEDK